MGGGLGSGCHTTGLVPRPPKGAQGMHAAGVEVSILSLPSLPSESEHNDGRSAGGYLHSGPGLAPSRVRAPKRVLTTAASAPVRSGTRVQADFVASKCAPCTGNGSPCLSGEEQQSKRGWNRSPVRTWGHGVVLVSRREQQAALNPLPLCCDRK